jgi:hypothetical protein
MAKHAKRRKPAKKTHRRRRVGAVALNANSPLVKYGSIALGYVMGSQVDTLLAKVVPANVDGKIIAAGELGLGAFLAFGKGTKKLQQTVIGGLLIGAGIKKGMTAFGIGGFQMVPAVGGYRSVQAVGAPKRLSGYNAGRNGLTGYSTFRSGTIDGGLMNSGTMAR